MGKRTKLKSNYRKKSKRTRKYSFKKRKNTRKRQKQKGGSDTKQQTLNNNLLKACDEANDPEYSIIKRKQKLIKIQNLINEGADIDYISTDHQLLEKYNNDNTLLFICPLITSIIKKDIQEILLSSGAKFEVVGTCFKYKKNIKEHKYLSQLNVDSEHDQDKDFNINRRLIGDDLHKLIDKNKIDSITVFLKKYIKIFLLEGNKSIEYINPKLNINVKDSKDNYKTPLIKSIINNLPDIGIELLILGEGDPTNNELKDYLYKIKVNSQDSEGNTALHHAIEKINDLIDKTEITDELYIKLESYFCLIQHIMKIYLEKRTDSMKSHFDQEVQSPLYITNKEGKPPFRRIMEYFPSEGANKKVIIHLEIIKFLRFYEKDPNKRVLKGKESNPWKNASSLMKKIYPLFQRSEESYSNKLLSLIPNYTETHVLNFLEVHHENIDLGRRDKKSMTILDHVIDREFIQVLQYLFHTCKKIFDGSSEDPLIKVVIKDKQDIMVNILNNFNPVNFNIQDNTGKTPLIYAIIKNSDIADLLVKDRRVDLNIQDYTGKTPLIHAIIEKNYAIAILLVSNSRVDVTIEDKTRKDALSHLLISACSEDTLDGDTYGKVINIITEINNKFTDGYRNSPEKASKYVPLIKNCSEKQGHRASRIHHLITITDILFPKNPSSELPTELTVSKQTTIDI